MKNFSDYLCGFIIIPRFEAKMDFINQSNDKKHEKIPFFDDVI